MIVAKSAIEATRGFLAGRAAEAPCERRDFWLAQLARYGAIETLDSAMGQTVRWMFPSSPQPAPEPAPGPLTHLPTVNVGISEPAGIVRFNFDGEIAFRETPQELAARAATAREVHIELNTSGGDCHFALEFGARLRATGARIVATAKDCFSAGVLLLQAAHVRRIHATGSLMVHAPRLALFGDALELERGLQSLRDAHEQNIVLLEQRTGQPRAVIADWLTKDTYFTATDAVAAGLVDIIAG